MRVNQSYHSLNFNERDPEIPLDLIVVHYTAMDSAERALKWLCAEESKVSCHYLIDEKGTIFQIVPVEKRAWHAGESFWQGIHDINSRSIGIELSNLGDHPYPSSQIRSLLRLLHFLTRHYEIPPKNIAGHSDVAPLRKKDPGTFFPWKKLAQKGFGIWVGRDHLMRTNMCVQTLQKNLRAIGYDCPMSGDLDKKTEEITRAFFCHFYPKYALFDRNNSRAIGVANGLLQRFKEKRLIEEI